VGSESKLKVGPFVITKTMPKLNKEMSEQVKSLALDINIYGNQRQYLYASKEIAESKMTYDLCMFEPEYAFEFKYKDAVDYFFISKSCEKIAHSYLGDFIYEDLYGGARTDIQNIIKKIFEPAG
jgi:hypothetical protein